MKSVEELKVLAKVVFTCSGLVGASGISANLISLSYFIKRCKKGVSRRLFILLNVFDLLVCVSEVLTLAFYHCENPDYCGDNTLSYRIGFTVMDLSIESTGFATCLLGVTRVISVCFPFFQMNEKALHLTKAAFIGQEIFRALLRFYFFYVESPKLHFYKDFDNAVMIVLLTLFILVNTTSSILLSWKLLTDIKAKDDSHNNQDLTRRKKIRATVTVLIVSGFFLFFNTLFGIALYLEIFVGIDEVTTKVYVFLILVVWLAMPLNSALNPLIFFSRKREMRDFVKQLPRTLRRWLFKE